MSLQLPTAKSFPPRNPPALDTSAPVPTRTASQYTVTALTPGPDFPGAYPRSSDPLHSALDPTNAALDGLLDAARQYIPGQDDVGKVLSQAAQVAGQYLPQAVTSYFPASATRMEKRDEEGSSEKQDHENTPRVEVTPAPAAENANIDTTEATVTPDGLDASDRFASTNVKPTDAIYPPALSGTAPLNEHKRVESQNAPSNSQQPASDIPANMDFKPADAISPRASPATATASESDQTETQKPSTVASQNTGVDNPNTPSKSPSADSETQNTPSKSRQTDTQKPSPTTGVQTQNTPSIPPFPAREPVLNTTPRTHPLAKQGARWGGVPLEEAYQAALDANPDKQLGIGMRKGTARTDAVPAPDGEEGTGGADIRQGIREVRERIVGPSQNAATNTNAGEPPVAGAAPESNVDSSPKPARRIHQLSKRLPRPSQQPAAPSTSPAATAAAAPQAAPDSGPNPDVDSDADSYSDLGADADTGASTTAAGTTTTATSATTPSPKPAATRGIHELRSRLPRPSSPSPHAGIGSNASSTRADTGHGGVGVGQGHRREQSASGMVRTATAKTQEQGQGQGQGGRSASQPPGEGRRTGLMDMLKGEVKVISGKIGRNEGRVERGRKLMGKV